MQEIRFNQPLPPEKNEEVLKSVSEHPKKRMSPLLVFISSFLKTIVALILFVAVIYVGIYVYNKYTTSENQNYSAVFLSNGQVYFGKIKENNQKELILNNVYYLQVGSDGVQGAESLDKTHFNLVKLGSEIHGPTDELFINKDQVVFYEYLRPDSKLVESINSYKN